MRHHFDKSREEAKYLINNIQCTENKLPALVRSLLTKKDDAKEFLEKLLTSISSIEITLNESDCYIPSAKDFALRKLEQIEEMAKKYSEKFDDYPQGKLCP